MDQPTPVMLMVRELGAGGTERQLTEMAKALNGQGFNVHVGCFHEGFRMAELRGAGVSIVRFPVTSFMKPQVLRHVRSFGKYLKEHGIRLVHTFDYPLNCFGVPSAKFFNIPVVLSSQRALRELTPSNYRALLRWTDRLANGIVVNCRAVENDLVTNENVSREKIQLCYNGIDTGLFHPRGRRRVESVQDADLVIGVVCVLRPEKGLMTLIDAFAKVSALRPNMKLLIVGSGPEHDRLAARADELNIFDQCVFQPMVTDPAPLLRSMDIFVLPSKSEALSNALMEAMACGCAPIASNVGGNPELVRPNETGLLFERENSEQLAHALERLIEDQATRLRFSTAAANLISGEFSLAASANRMAGIYRQFLDPVK